jgi:hypothetical protein
VVDEDRDDEGTAPGPIDPTWEFLPGRAAPTAVHTPAAVGEPRTDDALGGTPREGDPPPEEPAGASNEPAPSGPEFEPIRAVGGRRNDVKPLLIAAVASVVVVLAITGYFLTRSTTSYPSAWDARIAPLAAQAERLRGLKFDHPVPVHFLSNAAFDKRVSVSDKLSASDRKQLTDQSAELASVGLVNPGTDLAKELDTTRESGIVAFYDQDAKDITIRGTGALAPATRVTLVHELTHVLQDQHFDLNKVQQRAADANTGSSSAVKGLIEGDANVVEDTYKGSLSAAERRAAAASENSATGAADKGVANVPAYIVLEEEAPYDFGPTVIKVLKSHGGTAAVNRAFTGPTPSDRIFLDPTAMLSDPKFRDVKPIQLGAGEKKIDSGSMDALDVLLVLGNRLDARRALAAADVYGGGQIASYRAKGRVCSRMVLQGETPAGTAVLTSAFRSWARAMPAAAGISVSQVGPDTRVRSCEPGRKVVNDAALTAAYSLAANRADLIGTFSGEGLPADAASCLAKRIVADPAVRAIIDQNPSSLTPQQTAAVGDASARAGRACRAQLG